MTKFWRPHFNHCVNAVIKICLRIVWINSALRARLEMLPTSRQGVRSSRRDSLRLLSHGLWSVQSLSGAPKRWNIRKDYSQEAEKIYDFSEENFIIINRRKVFKSSI